MSMANIRKKASMRKSEIIWVRVTPKQKERIEKLAKLREITVSELLKSTFDDLLDTPKKNIEEVWRYLSLATQIIDQKENEGRNHDE